MLSQLSVFNKSQNFTSDSSIRMPPTRSIAGSNFGDWEMPCRGSGPARRRPGPGPDPDPPLPIPGWARPRPVSVFSRLLSLHSLLSSLFVSSLFSHLFVSSLFLSSLFSLVSSLLMYAGGSVSVPGCGRWWREVMKKTPRLRGRNELKHDAQNAGNIKPNSWGGFPSQTTHHKREVRTVRGPGPALGLAGAGPGREPERVFLRNAGQILTPFFGPIFGAEKRPQKWGPE